MHPLIEQNRETIATLCRQYGVRQLAVFGSILRGDFDPERSDVDLVAEFGPPESGDLVGQYFDLKERLEQVLRRKVDLVELSAVRNNRMRQHIEATRVPVYVTH
ncbi:MAG: nucleotidyltransferase domain-containing protein [Pseudomonadota bacterium]